MTRERDVDQLIHAFMQGGPEELSERLLTGIRDEIHGTKQRTLWRPWRTPSMPRPIIIFAALGALLVAVAAMAVVGTGGRSVPSTVPVSPSPSASSSSSPSTSAVAAYPLADGEPWLLVEAEQGALLIKPDASGSHTILEGLDVAVKTPRWSNDGRQVTFEGNDASGSQVWVANADGTGARQLTETPDGCPNGTCTEAINPDWSPDGRSIAYVAPTHQADSFTKMSLNVVDVATGTSRELYSTTDASLARPSWSPDGKRIVLEILRYKGKPEDTSITSSVIGVVDVTGTDHTPRELTDASLLAGYPFWHPTSDLIVFRTNRVDPSSGALLDPAKASELYTIHPDGSGLTKITDNGVGGPIVRGPSWTPDGRILFGKLANLAADEFLRIIDADGSGEASATGNLWTKGEGKWRPGT